MKPMNTVCKILGALLIGAPAGMVIMTVGNTFNVTKRLPKATYKTYKLIWKSKWIGVNLKTSLSSLVPIGAALVPPVTAVGSAIAGLGCGFAFCTSHDISDGIKDCNSLVKTFDQWLGKFVDNMDAEDVRVVKAEDVVDIKIYESLRGVLCALVFSPIEAAGTTAVLLSKWHKIMWKTYKKIWEKNPETIVEFTFHGACTVLATAVGILVIPLTPLCTGLFSLGDMCYEGYKNGIKAAGKKCLDRVRTFNSFLNDSLDQLEQV